MSRFPYSTSPWVINILVWITVNHPNPPSIWVLTNASWIPDVNILYSCSCRYHPLSNILICSTSYYLIIVWVKVNFIHRSMWSAYWCDLVARRCCAIYFYIAIALQTNSKHCSVGRYFDTENITSHIFYTDRVHGFWLVEDRAIGVGSGNNEGTIGRPGNLVDGVGTLSEGGQVTPLESREEKESESKE